jgi:putative transposase
VALHLIERGKPTQNALIESFNGKFRHECLNQNWFVDLEDAREIEAWRVDYNTVRPHSSLRYLTPEEFAESVAARPAFPPHAGRPYRPSVGRFGCAGTREC